MLIINIYITRASFIKTCLGSPEYIKYYTHMKNPLYHYRLRSLLSKSLIKIDAYLLSSRIRCEDYHVGLCLLLMAV